MNTSLIAGKTLAQWKGYHPLIGPITSLEEVFWVNPEYKADQGTLFEAGLSARDVSDAEARFERFAPFLAAVFPETRNLGGTIESPLVPIPAMKERLESLYSGTIPGELLLKCDSHLAVSGSIKARGGFHEVFRYAETLALEGGLIHRDGDYTRLAEPSCREFFSRHAIAVGSTGNLGISIGIMGARLGFRVYVHMSRDAKSWKKELLTRQGVTVVEHDLDYSHAVAEGRKQAAADPKIHFVDDERSRDLFLGYAVAAGRLKTQMEQAGRIVDADHPLFVYLPCGVGGGPGGIAFGLKLRFGRNVHCFFAEPTHSPAMLLGLLTGLHDRVSVGDFGIDNVTEADGLAVGRPSGFVGRVLKSMISGVFTVDDDVMFGLLFHLARSESWAMEPSALAGMPGPARLTGSARGLSFLETGGYLDLMENATHIVWGTGGSMVPGPVMESYMERGRLLAS